MFLDYCLNNVLFWGKDEHHIWKDQSLFFHLHKTCYYKYAIGLQLLAIKQSVAQVLRGNLTLQLHPRIITLFNVKNRHIIIYCHVLSDYRRGLD
jgi:hypothetical protein